MKVFFIGAGPGDPDLITVKGRRILSEADTIIYAGSLVNPDILACAKPGAQIYNSAAMTLPEVLAVMTEAVRAGRTVARVHTGDPSLYGAIQEQMDALSAANIPFEVVPGVSSFLAAAAALKREYTLPGVTQTVIITRIEGRTAVPDKEKLEDLARHRATMCIFLSVQAIAEVAARLVAGGYSPDTPVAVVYKASWSDEKVLQGRLDTIADLVEAAGIGRTALIIVGDFLREQYALSRLYAPDFAHGFREARP